MEDSVERLLPEIERPDEPLCGVCRHPRSHHDRDTVRHEFNVDGRLVVRKADPVKASTPESVFPIDPVLRLVLIRRGLVTPEELGEIEKELRAVGYASAVAGSRREDPRPNAG